MPKITFLAASVPLTKTVSLIDGVLTKNSYPHVLDFTSHTFDLPDIVAFSKQLIIQQALGHCLLKGAINKELKNVSRANSTSSEQPTSWICFDLDKAPFLTPDEFMAALGLDDVSYTVQYSASHGLPDTQGLNCHVFCYLSHPLPAPQLKSWLMYINLKNPLFTDALRLTRSGIALSYPLDITTCQNDKLLYIAPPVFKGMKDPVKDRIQFVKRKKMEISITSIALHPPEVLKNLANDFKNEKRILAGLSPVNKKTVNIGEFEVQNGCGEMVITGGPKEERDFVYFNFNGGDSWGYYHPLDNFELIHNFKGEPCMRTKEALPDYYRQCVARGKEVNTTPTEDGNDVLAFRDKKTDSYWCGTWNAAQQQLELNQTKSETRMAHFIMSHKKVPPDFYPQWDMLFDPTQDFIVDMEAHVVNTYRLSEYLKDGKRYKNPNLGGCPTIARVIEHAVGTGAILEHFYNWLAVILQHKVKPITAWVLQGCQGTGKGAIINHILRPIIGSKHVVIRRADEIGSDFTGWLENAIIAFIDEIEVTSLTRGVIESKLKNFITEPTISIRRMRTDSYEVKSFVSFIFSSNKPQPVMIPVDDRRYNVGEYQTEKIDLNEDDIYNIIPTELQAFTDYLLSRKANRQLASTPLVTQQRSDIMALSQTSVDDTAKAILSGDLESLWAAMPDSEGTTNELHGMTPFATYANAYIALMKRCLAEHIDGQPSRLTRDQLGMIFEYCVGDVPKTPNKLTSYLRHRGIKTDKLRDGSGVTQGIKVTWDCATNFVNDMKLRRVK